MSRPLAVPKDDKDWTWVLHRRCPDCGFTAAEQQPEHLARRIIAVTDPWPRILNRFDVGVRKHPTRWSALEYGCHVRDVCGVFASRLALMLDQDDPLFDNWDQDETARIGAYYAQTPQRVAVQLTAAARALSDGFAAVGQQQWERTGRRTGGSFFTVATLGQYCLHDLVHHLVDVGATVPAPD
ncbi:DinB family protein [Dermacoccaceae bacterium W4C1]